MAIVSEIELMELDPNKKYICFVKCDPDMLLDDIRKRLVDIRDAFKSAGFNIDNIVFTPKDYFLEIEEENK